MGCQEQDSLIFTSQAAHPDLIWWLCWPTSTLPQKRNPLLQLWKNESLEDVHLPNPTQNPEKLPSQKEIHLPTTVFRGYVSFREGICLNRNLKIGILAEGSNLNFSTHSQCRNLFWVFYNLCHSYSYHRRPLISRGLHLFAKNCPDDLSFCGVWAMNQNFSSSLSTIFVARVVV